MPRKLHDVTCGTVAALIITPPLTHLELIKALLVYTQKNEQFFSRNRELINIELLLK
jgi:hypothetical protein